MDFLNLAVLHHEHQGLGVFLDTCSKAPEFLDGGSFVCPDAAGRAANAVRHHLPRSAKGGAIEGYLDRLFSMLGFMGSVAMGPSGPHAHFLRHSIDAFTIRALRGAERDQKDTGSAASGADIRTTTAAVLSIVRGVSNLEEELHHSFFSYIMLSTKAFVSIGKFLRFVHINVFFVWALSLLSWHCY